MCAYRWIGIYHLKHPTGGKVYRYIAVTSLAQLESRKITQRGITMVTKLPFWQTNKQTCQQNQQTKG